MTDDLIATWDVPFSYALMPALHEEKFRRCFSYTTIHFPPFISQVWFSNRRARLRKQAQTCPPSAYNPMGLPMSYHPHTAATAASSYSSMQMDAAAAAATAAAASSAAGFGSSVAASGSSSSQVA